MSKLRPNYNVNAAPDNVFFLFNKASDEIVTGEVSDWSVDNNRKKYFKTAGIHLINDLEPELKLGVLLFDAGVVPDPTLTNSSYAANGYDMLGVTTGAVYFGHFTRNVLLLGENSDAAGV